jgi:CheY-like chemotaxis protein
LLADDSATIRKVVELTFAEEGVDVFSVADGDAAMQKFVDVGPDLVMADVNMPGMNGYRLCEMIKQDDSTRHIPVILLVGSFEPFDPGEASRVGSNYYFTKPFRSIRELVEKVTEYLELSGLAFAPEPETADIEGLYNESFETTLEMPHPEVDAAAYAAVTYATEAPRLDETQEYDAEYGVEDPLAAEHEVEAVGPKAVIEQEHIETAEPVAEVPEGEFPDDGYDQFVERAPWEEPVPPIEDERFPLAAISKELGDPGMDDEIIETSHPVSDDELIEEIHPFNPPVLPVAELIDPFVERVETAVPLTEHGWATLGYELETTGEVAKLESPIDEPEPSPVKFAIEDVEPEAEAAVEPVETADEPEPSPVKFAIEDVEPEAEAAVEPFETADEPDPSPVKFAIEDVEPEAEAVAEPVETIDQPEPSPVKFGIEDVEPEAEAAAEPVETADEPEPSPVKFGIEDVESEAETSVEPVAPAVETAAASAEAPLPSHVTPELIEAIVQAVLEKMSDRAVRDVATEAVPRIAEKLIREALVDEKKDS